MERTTTGKTRWRAALSQMPVALTVETSCDLVGVVHAEAPVPVWSRTVALLETGSDTDIDDVLLGFEEHTPAIRRMKLQPVEGLRALVSGQFVVEEAEVTANRWNLDTGAGFENRNRFSLLEINARELTPLTLEARETSSCAENCKTSRVTTLDDGRTVHNTFFDRGVASVRAPDSWFWQHASDRT